VLIKWETNNYQITISRKEGRVKQRPSFLQKNILKKKYLRKMKKILSILLLASITTFAQTTSIDKLIKFEKTAWAFGKVKQNVPATYVFKFTNPGNAPIIIESAQAECGCTTPVYPTKPILKGKSGTIKVTYDAKNLGSFTKKVTIKLVNVAETKILNITGEVVAQ
jgi:hypothetical protein